MDHPAISCALGSLEIRGLPSPRMWRGKDTGVLPSASSGSDFSLAFYQHGVTLAKLWKLPEPRMRERRENGGPRALGHL